MLYSLNFATEADHTWLDELRRAAYEPLFHATWGGWDEDRHQRHFAATLERGQIQRIEVDGQPVGMLQLYEADDGIEIGEIQLLPTHQSKGLGTKVLVDIMVRAKHQGRDVILSTGLMNTGAQRLYKRLGFVVTERTDTHVHMRCSAHAEHEAAKSP